MWRRAPGKIWVRLCLQMGKRWEEGGKIHMRRGCARRLELIAGGNQDKQGGSRQKREAFVGAGLSITDFCTGCGS